MIYIASHKAEALPPMPGYQPMQVGFAAEDFPGYIRDNTGDSISDRNASFCELTALYWAWKNSHDAYKGLVHYRRYFGRRPLSSRFEDVLGYDELRRMLSDCDVIAAQPVRYHVSAKDQLCLECCAPETFDKLRLTVMELSPDYIDAFDAFFRGNSASQYNMIFAPRERFDAYCAWLFPILFRLEEQVDVSGLDDYRKRLFGFLGERLMNVWMAKNALRVRSLPVVSTAYSLGDHLIYLRRDITNELRFRLRGKR